MARSTVAPSQLGRYWFLECDRFLRTTPTGKLRVNRTAVRRDAHYDGKYLQLCWLALLLLRVTELGVGDTWRNIRDQLDRLHLVTLATPDGEVAQRGELTPAQRAILHALELPEPPRFFDFTPTSD